MDFSPFVASSEEAPEDRQTRLILQAVQDSHDKLYSVFASSASSQAASEAVNLNPLGYGQSRIERVDVVDLIQTEDELFDKILMVLTSLCEEMQHLTHTAEHKFYAPLSLFGFSKENDDEEWPDGELQLQIGRALPLLQDVANFGQRCNAVILNAVHQLCALYDSASTHLFALWRHVHLVPVFKHMGLLLACLQTLDAIVLDNEVLQEAWHEYKKLIVTSAAPPAQGDAAGEQGAATDAAVSPARALERMVAALDFSVLAGALYKSAVGQYFDVEAEGAADGTPPMTVSRNTAFHTELVTALNLLLEQSVARIGKDGEQNERLQLVGALSLFGLSRAILPPTAPPDVELYKKLWRTQEKVPCVPLYGRAVWFADTFLQTHSRMQSAVPPKKLVPRDPAAFRKAACEQLDGALGSIARRLAFKVHTWVGQFNAAWGDKALGPPPDSEDAAAASPFGGSSGGGAASSAPRRRRAAEAGTNTSFVTGNAITPAANKEVDSLMDVRLSLLQQGSSLAAAAQRMLTNFLALHDVTEVPCPSAAVLGAAEIACLQKVIESTLQNKQVQVAAFVPIAVRKAALPVLRVADRAEMAARAAEKAGKLNTHMAMQNTALHLMRDLFTGTETWNTARFAALSIAARVAVGTPSARSSAHLLPDGGADRISRCVEMIEVTQTSLALALANCNARILYWHRQLLPPVIHRLAMGSQGGFKSGRLQFLLSAMSDACMMLTQTAHEVPVGGGDTDRLGGGTAGAGRPGTRYERLYSYYCDWLLAVLKTQVIQPAARAVQLQLRLQAYVVAANSTHKTPPNPRKILDGAAGGGAEQISEGVLRSLPGLLRLAPLAVGRVRVHVASAVASLLEEDFYKLIVVAPHDWRLYAQMAALARTHYGLSILDPHLPAGVVDSGLDVLQIMRNIRVFCSRYNYNMNTQTFIERKPEQSSKHMHTVNVQSITASIRQHGAGMLNTTVNFAFQYLSKFLRILSRSLQDERVKSYLSRERRWFKKNRKTLKGLYPFDHAEKLVKEVQKWRMVDKNASVLDKLREHVAQMGNALGYVRMVRTAGMNQSSSAAQFLPDLGRVIDFEAAAKNVAEAVTEMLIGEPLDASATANTGEDESKADTQPVSLSDDTVDAARALNSVIRDVTDKFTSSADYLRVLKDAFRGAADKIEAASAASAQQGGTGSRSVARENHLRNFFLLVPGMTLSFVKALRSSRDQLDKVHKGRTAYFTDDGFAMGVAFLLSVFRQDKMFDAMHWFDSVREQHRGELRNLQDALRGAPTRGKEAKQHLEELQFKERRLHNVQREFDCIEYALSGARIFFRDEHKAVQTKYGGGQASASGGDGDGSGDGAGAQPNGGAAAAPAPAVDGAPASGAGAVAPPPTVSTAPPAAAPAAAPAQATTPAPPPSTTPAGDPTAATPAAGAAATPAPSAAAAVPPAYKRYDMLRKMGMPDAQLAMKMEAEGMDPGVLGIAPSSTALAVVE